MPSSAPYLNFDLLITRAGERYRALVVDAPGGDADIFFDLPPSLPGFQELLALTGPRRGLRDTPTPTTPAASLDEVGRTLYEAIFQGEVRDVLIASQREAADNTAGLRLRLRFHEDAAELATLPWELLYDAGQERFLALSENLPILRYLSLPRPRPALVTAPPLRILAVLASPDGLDELNLEAEWQVLAEALSPLVDDGKVLLERLASPTPSALQGRLLGDPIHVLHFVGHGVFDEESKQGMLVLADERNQSRLMGARELATLLANHTSLRLLYLNACEGALGDNTNVFAGLAQRLVQGGAPAAIAMQAEISDKASIDLARTFYTALATGRPVDAALTQARVTLAMNSSVEWATPVLFSRAPDNRLFDIRDVLPTPDCPYPGMKPFREDQQQYFFGRDKEIDDAVNRLAKHPFLAVVGPSGSGKSSLVYAGILPALRASRRFGPGPWTVHTLRPSDVRTAEGKAAPFQALLRLISGQLSVTSHQSSEPERHASTPDPQSPVPSPQSPVLLFIDQFEETFTLADADEARSFLEAVHGLIGQPNLHILLTVRADFYAEMMAMGDLWADVQARRLELTPLGEDELWTAIVEPAARVGVEVEDALATALIADARGEAGVLPLVQETLVRLWDKVEGRQLKRAAYRQMAVGGRSGIQVAINDHANDIYHTLPAADRFIARRIFLRLIQFGEGRADTRRQQTVAELRAGGDDPVRFDEKLRALVDGRLLTTSGEEGDPNRRVDISHEALIGGWSLLQGWISEMRVAESTRRRLEDKVTEWLRLERSGGLLDEYEVLEVEAWLAGDYSSELRYRQELIDLKNASRAALASAAAEKAEAERTRRRAQIFAGGLVLAALVIALVGYFAWTAETARGNAEADREIAVTAQAVAEIQADGAATQEAVAVQQAEIAATQEAEANMARATAEAAEAQARNNAEAADLARADAESARAEVERLTRGIRADQLTSNALQVVDESPPLALLLAAEGLRAQADFTTTQVMILPVSPKEPIPMTHAVVVSESVVPSARSNVHELLRQTGGWPRVGHEGEVVKVVFSPDGAWLASGSADSTVRLWNVADPKAEPVMLWGHEDLVETVAFSPDGKWLASSGGDDWEGTMLLWDVEEPEAEPLVLQGHEANVTAVAFSPDEEWLASGSWDDTVRLWRMADLEAEPLVFQGRWGGIYALAFSPDGSWLAGGGGEDLRSTLLLWRMTDLAADPLVLRGHEDRVRTVAFSPDGAWLASGSEDSTVRLWNVAEPEAEPVVLPGHEGSIMTVAFSRDGAWLAGGGGEDLRGTLWLWRVAEPEAEPVVLQGHEDLVKTVAFSPDGAWLASGSADTTVRLWNVAEPETEPVVLRGHEDWVETVAFSPDGAWLASGSADTTVRLWRWHTAAQIGLLCGTAGRNLSQAEWVRYFPSQVYRKTCTEWPVHPSVTQSLRQEAEALAQQGEFDEATALFTQALAYDPTLEIDPAERAAQLAPSPIAYGETVTGTVATNLGQLWLFEGAVGDVVTIVQAAAEGSGLDSYLTLYGPDGEVLAENDDFDGKNSQIGAFVLPDDGTYHIRADGYNDSSGAYILELRLVEETP